MGLSGAAATSAGLALLGALGGEAIAKLINNVPSEAIALSVSKL